MFNLKGYLPSYYEGVREFTSLLNCEESMLTEVDVEIKSLIQNMFVYSAGAEVLSEWERMLSIPYKGESLAFRRERIINRISMKIPFTEQSLRYKLDELIGSGKYNLSVDYLNYEIEVEASIYNQQWFNEFMVTINKIKPCNMIFINKPTSINDISITETVSYSAIVNNYVLGKWALGLKAFRSLINGQVIKVESVKSITPALLESLANDTAHKIVKIRLNDMIEINEMVKSVNGSSVVVEYDVAPSQDLTEITKVELMDNSGAVLSSISAYVEVEAAISMKHTINLKEVL